VESKEIEIRQTSNPSEKGKSVEDREGKGEAGGNTIVLEEN
jgi:hypothetical protein